MRVGRIIHHKSDISTLCKTPLHLPRHISWTRTHCGSTRFSIFERLRIRCDLWPVVFGAKGEVFARQKHGYITHIKFITSQPSLNFDNFVYLTYANFKPCACVRSLDVSGYFAFPRENKRNKLFLSRITKPLHIQKKEKIHLHVASLLLFTQMHVCQSPSGGLSEPAKLVTGIARIRLGL